MHAIPQRCAHRPLSGGLVVPYVTLIHDGHAAFGVLDADKTINAFRRRLCQICEHPLDERCFLLVRPADVVKGCSPEPALHPECLPYTADHCPMLNGSRTHYRRSPVLVSHPAGRPCTDPSCLCLSRTTDEGHAARSGSPADRYEAWMIHTRNYQLVSLPDRPDVPSGISLDAPVLRKRVLRTATLSPDAQHLMDLWNALLGGGLTARSARKETAMPINPDPATPTGGAIIDLADLMDGLQERTGEWPGADTVDILGGWLSRFSFAVHENLTPQVTGRAWVLRQWDRHSDDVTLWSDEASALASLARDVRSSWDGVAGEDGVPFRPPADDRRAVDLFYGSREDIEGYTLYDADISRCVLAPRNPSLSDAEECAEANSAAVFHAMRGPDDEGLPCMEIAGILVFAYLDADRGAVRVSVHLDTTDEQLVRADSTVPLLVEIGDATVFDNLAPPPAPAQPTGWKARFRRLTRRTALSGGGKCRQGG